MQDWKHELKLQAEKYHKIGAWVAIIFNPVWAIIDYIALPNYWVTFLSIRLTISCITLIALFSRKKLNLNPEWLIFIPLLGIALQNAYMYSVMDVDELQKHTFAYIALFIGAGMLILWRPIYSFIVVGLNIVANLILFPLNSSLTLEEILVNGGMLTLTVTIFTILLIHTRYMLTKKEIIARLALEESKKIIEEKNKDILDSIVYAKRIQEAILPATELIDQHLDNYFILYQPRDIVCGDFYWFTHQDGKSYIAAVDCTGHGVPGAFMSMIGNTLLNEIVIEKKCRQPGEILNALKKAVIKALQQSGDNTRKDGMDIAMCCIDEKNMVLEYAGAFNPLYMIRNGELIETKATKQPIGNYLTDADTPFTNHIVELKAGDAFYLFSDGFVDQFGGKEGKKYMSKNFKNLLLQMHKKPMPEQKKVLQQEFTNWMGDIEQVDDVLVIGLNF